MENPPPDPHDTQPLPSQPPFGHPASDGQMPAAAPAAPPPPFVHPFGNVGVYLLARLGAFVVDIFALWYLFATIGLQLSTGGSFAFGGHDATSFTLLLLTSFGATILLLILSEGIFGTSLGKLIFGLHVRRTNGRWVGPGRALLRMLLRPIDVVLIGPVLAAITPRHQRLGDFAAGTVVGRSRIGWFSTLLGIVIVLLVGYAQITYGGGVTTALTFAAEGATYLPQFYRTATQPFAAVPTSSPYAVPTLAPQNATAEPQTTPSAASEPSASATEAPAAATEAPTEAPTDAPTNEPTDAPTAVETG